MKNKTIDNHNEQYHGAETENLTEQPDYGQFGDPQPALHNCPVPGMYQHPAPATMREPSLLRRMMQKWSPKPIRNAAVRFDAGAGKWGVIDPRGDGEEIKQHFNMAVMDNVRFETRHVETSHGCGPAERDTIGVAVGDLFLHKTRDDDYTALNLRFDGHSFIGQDGRVLTRASSLLLFEDRRAYYTP